jgi:hypothetical protein
MVQPYGLDAGVRRRPVMSAFALPVMMANVRSTAAIRRAEPSHKPVNAIG